jgi:PTH1 family peptidyl-tRNA hydrolase
VLLVKPQTYMNLSGESIRALLEFYQIPPSEILVVYDDASLPVGDIRLRPNGGAGGHNGMKSLIAHLKTQDFARVRIGIGAKPEGWVLADYVLSRFGEGEWDAMVQGVTKAGEAVELWLKEGTEAAMNRYNKKLKKGNGDVH